MKDISREHLHIVCSVCFAAFMATLDTYIVNVSLPTIARFFSINMSTVSLVALSYLLSLSSTTLIFGKVIEEFGLRRVFIMGYLVFVLGSFLCGLSPGEYYLVAFRFIQGVGGAMIIVAAYAAIPRYLPKEIRGWAFGIFSVTASLGITVGAPLGGFITGCLSWHWIFLINVPIGIAAAVYCWRILPADVPSAVERGKSFDTAGAICSFISILCLIYGMNSGSEQGWTSPLIITSLALFITFAAAFVFIEMKAPDPLLDLRIIRNSRFIYALVSMTAAIMFMAGNNFLMPFYLEIEKGLKPQSAGLVIMIYSVAYMLVGPFAGRASDRIRPAIFCTVAMLSAAFACIAFAFSLSSPGLLPAIIFLSWIGVSYALFISPNCNMIMSLAPEDVQGVVSGVYNLIMRVSLALGVCFFETIISESVPGAGAGLSDTGFPHSDFSRGFKAAYIAGAVLCFLAMVVPLLFAMRKVRLDEPRDDGPQLNRIDDAAGSTDDGPHF